MIMRTILAIELLFIQVWKQILELSVAHMYSHAEQYTKY